MWEQWRKMDPLKFETENSLLKPAASAHSTQDPVNEDESMNIIILNTFTIMPELIRLDDDGEDQNVQTSNNISKQPRNESCYYSVIPKILKPSRQKSDYYQCKFCSEPFSMLRYLRKHFTTPNKELPNKCQEYYTAGSANGHMSALNKFCTKNANTLETEQMSNDEEGNDDEVQILRVITKFNASLPEVFVSAGSKITENLEQSFWKEICPDDQQMEKEQNIVNDQLGLPNSLQDRDHLKVTDKELASDWSNDHEILYIATRCNEESIIGNDNCRDQIQLNCEKNYTESLNVEIVGETLVLDTQAERPTSQKTTSVEHLSVGYATRSKSLPIWQQRNSSIQKWKQASKGNSKRLSSVSNMNAPKLAVHTGIRYKCDLCQKEYSYQSTMMEHKRVAHDGYRRKCEVCLKEFRQIKNLNRHKLKVHQSSRYVCDSCPKAFIAKAGLRRHKVAVHNMKKDSRNYVGLEGGKRFSKLQQQESKSKNEKNFSEGCYTCNLCKDEFSRKLPLKRHKLSAHGLSPVECEICSKRFSTVRNMNRHKLGVHEKFRYKCNVCQKEYSQLGYMREHKRVAHKGYRYKCDLCQKEYSQLGYMKEHKQVAHKGYRYKCDLCEKEYSHRHTLKEHKRVEHEGHCYKCEFCLKEFKRLQFLKEHERSVHHGLHYECDLCPKDFCYSASLRLHKSRAHRCSKFFI